MSDIYDLMADEARQSFFQLENVTAALDSKAFGAMTADAFLFTIFVYISSPISSWLYYIPMTFIIISFVSLLASVWPRRFYRQFSDDTIKNYGRLDPKQALAQIAANYADLESRQYEAYKNKSKWFLIGLISMVLAMVSETAILAFISLCP